MADTSVTSDAAQRELQPTVTVAVVCICGAPHLARCLEALRAQEAAGPFRVVVRYDPALPGIDAVAARYPEAVVRAEPGRHTPLELCAAAIEDCDSDVILLTEDHGIPATSWVRSMLAARAPDRVAVGGRMEIRSGASATDWAFYYADFFRYAAPVQDGPSPTLTVCNVAYDRARLEAIRDLWSDSFEEPAVHDALRARFGGVLWLTSASEVRMRRTVSLSAALEERYAFGRIFGHTRIAHMSPARRLLMMGLGLALPALLLGRMTAKALASPGLTRAFVRGLGPLTAMVLCWSWGEWLGYVTGRPPRRLRLASEQPSSGQD